MTGRNREVLRRWCAAGTIPAIRIGRTWALSRETLHVLVVHAARARPRFGSWDTEPLEPVLEDDLIASAD